MYEHSMIDLYMDAQMHEVEEENPFAYIVEDEQDDVRAERDDE